MNILYNCEIIDYTESFDTENNITYISKIDWRYIGTNENNITSYIDGVNYFGESTPYTSTTEVDLINMVIGSNNINELQTKISLQIYNIVYPRTYKWFIYSLGTIPNFEGYSNFVTTIYWRYNATSDSGEVANIEGQTVFNKKGSVYVDYYDLTENDITNWIELTEDINYLREKLDITINQKIEPLIVNLPLPW
jgi:hypothetical protein